MDKLLRFDDQQPYVIFDMETCHLNGLQDNFPWQLGFLVCTNKEILEQHSYYIYWDNMDKKISDDAKRVTRFNFDEYKANAKPQKEILDLFESYLYNDKYILLGHNTHAFDHLVHLQWRKANGKREDWSFLPRAIDTNSVAKMIKLGIKSIKREDWPVMMYKYSNYKAKGMKTNLTALGHEYGIGSDLINYDALHSALEDIKLNFHVWQKMKFMIDI